MSFSVGTCLKHLHRNSPEHSNICTQLPPELKQASRVSGTVINTIIGAWLLDRLPHEADDWSLAEVRQRGRQIGSLGEKGERFKVGHLGR